MMAEGRVKDKNSIENDNTENQEAASISSMLKPDVLVGLKDMTFKERIAFGTALGQSYGLKDIKFPRKIAKWYLKLKLRMGKKKTRSKNSSSTE